LVYFVFIIFFYFSATTEIYTLPGSLAFYLWEPSGVPFPELLATMIGYAQARYREKRRSTFTFSSSLLSGNALLGPKTGEA
jgi:D-alanine-D-alanine ligase